MVGIKGESTSSVEEIRAGIQHELDTEGGLFAYNKEGKICLRRTYGSVSVLFPIDLESGIVDSPTLPQVLQPDTLTALRKEVGLKARDPGKKTG